MKLAEWLNETFMAHFSPGRVTEWDLELPKDVEPLLIPTQMVNGSRTQFYLLSATELIVGAASTENVGDRILGEEVTVRRYPLDRFRYMDRTYRMIPKDGGTFGYSVETVFTLHFSEMPDVSIALPVEGVQGNWRTFMTALSRLG